MKLNFVVDKNYLVAHTLSCMKQSGFSSQKYKKDIVAFQNYAWNKSQKVYDLLVGRFSFFPDDLNTKNLKSLAKELNQLSKFLDQLSRSKEFKKIYSQTEKYLEFCEKQWNKNCKETNRIVEELTGLNLNKTFTVYLTHPSQRNGVYLGKNKIAWGHSEKWKNYTTVYLWHEILHSYFDLSDLSHAIIELITDEEMRSRLNNSKYPPFVGHEYLSKLKKKLLPPWKQYLKSDKKDIKKFQNSVGTQGPSN